MSDNEKKKANTDRRSFLKLAGLGAVSGSAALVTGTHTVEAAKDAKAAEGLYRETEHVRRYYELAKFL